MTGFLIIIGVIFTLGFGFGFFYGTRKCSSELRREFFLVPKDTVQLGLGLATLYRSARPSQSLLPPMDVEE